jgi:hypothetical protein
MAILRHFRIKSALRRCIGPLLWLLVLVFVRIAGSGASPEVDRPALPSPAARTPTPTPAPTPTPTPSPTPTPGPKYLHLVYDWSASKATSYLGAVTEFPAGTKVWGQIVVPALGSNPPPPYLANNATAFGSASIDVLVGKAQNDNNCTTCTIKCYADWNPQYPSGSGTTLRATSYDPAQNPSVIQDTTVTINPGGPPQPSKYTPIPATNVATITYNPDGTFTLTAN